MKDVDALYRQASHHLAQGQLAPAAELAERILRQAPDHPGGLHLLGFIHLQSRAPEKALPLLARAVDRDPRNATVLFHLATAQLQAQRWEEARPTLERLLAMKPESLDVRSMLADVLERSSEYARAVECYQRLIEREPASEALRLRQGNCHLQLGEFDAAADCYRAAIRINPASPFAYYNLSLALRHANRGPEARQAADQALALQPDYPAALLNLGILEEQDGEIERAATSYRKALGFLPSCAAAYWSLANLRSVPFTPEESAAMGRLAQDERLSEGDRTYVHFALAKDLDDRHRYAEAFEHLTQANALKRRSAPYERARIESQFAGIRSAFDAAFFAARTATGLTSVKPIFIVGMPRSGSTLIEQILASHSLVSGGGELRAGQDIAHRTMPERYGSPFFTAAPTLADAELAELARLYVSQIAELAIARPRFTDKTPDNFMLIGLLRVMFPNATFIHARRHPIDACLSCYRQFFTEGQHFSYDLGDLVHYYRLYRTLMDAWDAVLPGAILDVDYEALVQDPEAQMRRLLEFCGLAWEPACLAFHETTRAVKTASVGQVRRPIYRSSVSQWENYKPYIEPLIDGLRDIA